MLGLQNLWCKLLGELVTSQPTEMALKSPYKVIGPNLITYLDRRHQIIFDCYMATCVSKNGHQRNKCLKETGLHVQNVSIIHISNVKHSPNVKHIKELYEFPWSMNAPTFPTYNTQGTQHGIFGM